MPRRIIRKAIKAMDAFPFPETPTSSRSAFEDLVIRWVVVILPLAIIGHILGALTLVAFLISSNFNLLGWIE
jgi:hypothetical protein